MSPVNTISPSVKFGLRFSGIWPGTPFPLVYKFIWVTTLSTIQTYQYKYIIMNFRSESFMQNVDNLSISLSFTVVYIKLVLTWINYGCFSDILFTMEEDCEKYSVMDVNNLIAKTGQVSNFLTNIIMFSYTASAVFYLICDLISQDLTDVAHRQLYFRMELPFEFHKSPIYEILIIAQFFIHIAGCKIDIMCQQLMEYPRKKESHVKVFIKQFQEIISFTQKIEKYFTYIAVSQFLSNTIVSCCKGFTIAATLGTDDAVPRMIQSIMYYIIMCAEAFVYCYSGEYLCTKSKTISDSVYDFLWYELHPRESQLLVPVILRSQKGFILTFGKFSNLSLESFSRVSYSFFVLGNFYFLYRTICTVTYLDKEIVRNTRVSFWKPNTY
ncbi:Putative odorant receptor 63a [Eufriesea mexicana]|uniref:Odorant receptor n=1 Tax=Eufriesea mexicana TaxID=516756 RepID=A0A310SGR1_9HYME|nr:Putative odorant receptor 63a [Eufriesea mexicana]